MSSKFGFKKWAVDAKTLRIIQWVKKKKVFIMVLYKENSESVLAHIITTISIYNRDLFEKKN